MSYKTILVHAQDDDATQGRSRLAVDVARLFDATVFGVGAESWFPIAALPEYGYVPGDVLADLEAAALKRIEAAKGKFHDLARGAGRPCLWTSTVDTPCDALLQHARSADLIVISRVADPGAEGLVARPSDVVLGAGLPVLIAADGLGGLDADHVVIAWKNTRECRRAISEAMPFLERASGVTLAQAGAEDRDALHQELEAVSGRLLRRGVRVEAEILPSGHHVCESLESLAARKGADLIVMGAYGHSRLRENVFGGVTQGFLERGTTHVLMSH